MELSGLKTGPDIGFAPLVAKNDVKVVNSDPFAANPINQAPRILMDGIWTGFYDISYELCANPLRQKLACGQCGAFLESHVGLWQGIDRLRNGRLRRLEKRRLAPN